MYVSAGVCSRWIDFGKWRMRMSVSQALFSRQRHRRGDPCLHLPVCRRRTLAARHRVEASGPASLYFRIHSYKCAWMMMPVVCQADSNSACTSNLSMLDHFDLLHTLRDRYFLAPMDRQHRLSCVLQKFAESPQGWAWKHLHMQFDTK